MSQTVQGRIIGGGGTRFTAIFIFSSGTEATFLGEFTASVPPFISSNATLRFTDDNDPTGFHQFDGHLGVSDIKLNLADGLTMEGPLDMPVIPPINVSGSGEWAAN